MGENRSGRGVIHLEDHLNFVQHGKWAPSTALSAAASRAARRFVGVEVAEVEVDLISLSAHMPRTHGGNSNKAQAMASPVFASLS